MSRKKRLILLALTIYEIGVAIISVHLSLNVLYYMLLSWAIPSSLFLTKIRYDRKHIFLTSILTAIPMSLVLDYLGHISRSWNYWNNPSFAVSNIKLLPNQMPIESFFWGFLFWIFTISTYEYFFDKHRSHELKTSGRLLFILFFLLAFATSLIPIFNWVIFIPYYYAVILLIFFLFVIFLLQKNRVIFVKMIQFGIISFIWGITVEIASLMLNLWTFQSDQYLFMLNFFNHRLPIEEILWWIVLPMAIVLHYEVFTDTGD